MDHPIAPKNWVDRAIEAVAPAAAARRYEARARIAAARDIPLASYRGAMATRTSLPWEQSTSFRGGTSLQRFELGEMRDRARNSYENNIFARSLQDTETDNVIAEGLTLQMRSGNAEFNDYAETRFYKWLDKADIAGKWTGSKFFRESWARPRIDGDGGILLIKRGGYPYLQYIPGDLIANPKGKWDWKTMFDGVECDPSGRPVRFWIRDVDEKGANTSTAVDARDFVFISHASNPLDVRGATVYTPVFELLDEIDLYRSSVVKAAHMACIFGLIHKTRNPAAAIAPLGTATNSDGVQQKAVTYEGGMLKVHGTDDQLYQVVAQQPMQQTPDFHRALLRIACLAYGMPLEIGGRDLSTVNFSGGRIGLNAWYRTCRVRQDWIRSVCWNRIVFWWLSVEKQRQQLGFADAFEKPFPDDYGEFELVGQEWSYNDPQTEAAALLLEISAGINSPQRGCAERNRDYNLIQKQLKEYFAERIAEGLPIVLSSQSRDAGSPPTPEPTPDTSAKNGGKNQPTGPAAAASELHLNIQQSQTPIEIVNVIPSVEQSPPVVNVSVPPAPTQPPPVVNVTVPAQPPAQVCVTVPAQPPPVVNVLPPRRVSKVIKRDARGRITGIEDREE
jgi:capsid protein